ncbi:hypothetical protein F5Y05DRAFT_374930 [Hypoxylon sp. FL0543]|nr:hypothetical protein F5Y05DRAFT_374930 [Hypoxylon sp. FL0543]
MAKHPHSAGDVGAGFIPQASDVYIAVMGVTGAGKSTLISTCTEMEVKIGHNLQACTRSLKVYPCSLFKNRNVYLVDTPGFDDTNRTDKEVLKEIAFWLGTSYKQRIRLSGIIYLHRITDNRMQGSARKNLYMFNKLCGPNALRRVILATTMWERLSDEGVGVKHEKELTETEDFWGFMIRQGSQVRRHYNTGKSAKELLQIFVTSNEPPVALKIQEEMVDAHRRLDETSAGRELDSILAQEREKYRREFEEMKAEMKEALVVRDNEMTEIFRQYQKELSDKIETIDRDRQELKVSLENMYSERIAELENQLRHQQDASSEMRKSMQEKLASMKLEDETSSESKDWQMVSRNGDFRPEETSGSDMMNTIRKSNEGQSEGAHPAKSSPTPPQSPPDTWVVRGFFDIPDEFHPVIFIHDENWYFGRGGKDDYYKLPSDVGDFLGGGKINKVRFISAGMHDCIYAVCTGSDNAGNRTFKSGLVSLVYTDLNHWLESASRPQILEFSLGPNWDYFARDADSDIQCSLPETFPTGDSNAQIEKVAFGYDDTYVVIFSDGSVKYHLGKYYPYLATELDSWWEAKIVAIQLDVKHPSSWIVIFGNGIIMYHATSDATWTKDLRDWAITNYNIRWW